MELNKYYTLFITKKEKVFQVSNREAQCFSICFLARKVKKYGYFHESLKKSNFKKTPLLYMW